MGDENRKQKPLKNESKIQKQESETEIGVNRDIRGDAGLEVKMSLKPGEAFPVAYTRPTDSVVPSVRHTVLINAE